MITEAPADEAHFQRYLAANCFADTVGRDGLDMPICELITFAILAGFSGVDAQVRAHVPATPAAGNTRANLLAVLTVLMPFIGYSRTLNVLTAVTDITRPWPGSSSFVQTGFTVSVGQRGPRVPRLNQTARGTAQEGLVLAPRGSARFYCSCEAAHCATRRALSASERSSTRDMIDQRTPNGSRIEAKRSPETNSLMGSRITAPAC